MKEIGERFKEKRNEIGISVKEVSNDLNVDEIIIENLEEGNNKVFKDVLEFKDVIMTYTKYLGLDEEEISDDINDYLYDKTSKIKLEDIKEEINKNINKIDDKKVRTPYTIERRTKTDYSIFIICIVIVLLLVIFYFVLKKLYSI